MSYGEERRTFAGTALSAVLAIVGFVLLLMVELVCAMLAYIYLALYDIELFGYLVRLSRDVLNLIASSIEPLFPGSANQAYATLIGEFSPKSILLLLIGLVMGAVVRLVVWSIARMFRRVT